MLLGARQFFERRGAPTPPLPYDAEVEYLRRNNGTGIAVYTGVYISDDNFVIECDCKIDSVAVPWVGPFSTYRNEQTESTRVLVFFSYLDRCYAGYRRMSSNQSILNNIAWKERNLFRLEKRKLTITPHGGISYEYTIDAPSSTVDGGLEMMVAGVSCDIYYYGFKILHDGVPVLDYIPVRKGSVGYFFDTVSGTLVGIDSGASDQFIVGPDKS